MLVQNESHGINQTLKHAATQLLCCGVSSGSIPTTSWHWHCRGCLATRPIYQTTIHAHPTTLAHFVIYSVDPMHWRGVLCCLRYRTCCRVGTAGGCIPLLHSHVWPQWSRLQHPVQKGRSLTTVSGVSIYTQGSFLSSPAIVTAGRSKGRRHSMRGETQRRV